MADKELDISLGAMAERGGVTVPAFYYRGWKNMTLEFRVMDSEVWIEDLDATIEKKTRLRDSLIDGKKEMEAKIAELKKFEEVNNANK